MATSYLTWNKLNNLDDEIFHCINQLKVYKKRNNIDSIYEQLLYINKYLNIIFWRDCHFCQMNKRSRSRSLIILLLIQ